MTLGLLGAHIGGCAKYGTSVSKVAIGLRRDCFLIGLVRNCAPIFPERPSEPPIDDKGFTEHSQHDVIRFQIAMDNTTTVDIGHRITHSHEVVQQFT